MATEIAFSATVETGEGAKSLRSLKEEFKNTQKELDGLTVGSEKYIETLKKLGGIKDEIGDLNSEINSFNPEGKIQAFTNVLSGVASGFQVVTGAAALFGTENKDLEKTLVKLQAVMAFTEGIKGVTSLADGFSVLASNLKTTAIGTKIVTAAQWLWNAAIDANPIGLLVAGLVALVAGLKAFAAASEDAALKQQRLNELQKENEERLEGTIGIIKKRLQISIDANERELELLKASGASQKQIFDKEQDINRQKMQMLSYVNGYRGKLNDEELKQQADLLNERKIKDIQYAKSVQENENKIAEQKKSTLEKIKIDREKHEEELQRFRDAEAQWDEEQAKKKKERELELFNIENQQREEAIAEATKWLDDYNKNILAGAELRSLQFKNDLDAQLAYLEAQKQNELLNKELTENEKLVIAEKYKQQEVELTKKYKIQEAQESLQIAQQSTQALQGLSDLFFSIKMANVKKGSKEEEAAARKQFKINKALSIASTLISGAQGVVNGLSAPYPQNIILPVLAGITTAASIAKISATQYEGGGSSGGSSNIASMNTGGLNQPAPTLNAPNTGSTMLNPDGTVKTNGAQQQQPIQAYVVETQLTQVQGNVSAIENAAIH